MRSCVSFASQWAPSWVLTDGKSFQLLRSPCDLSKAFHQVEGHESERTRQSCGSYKTWYHETIRKLFSKYSFGNAKGIKYTNRSIQKSYGSLTYEKKETKNQYVKKNKRRKKLSRKCKIVSGRKKLAFCTFPSSLNVSLLGSPCMVMVLVSWWWFSC